MSILKTQSQEQKVTSVEIWQVKGDLSNRHDIIFCNLDYLKKQGVKVNNSLYEKVWEQPVNEIDAEHIFYEFNVSRPEGFKGHSLSVSDMVVYKNGEDIVTSLFCDSIGFTEIPDFFVDSDFEHQIEHINDRINQIYDRLYQTHNMESVTKEMTYQEALNKGDMALANPALNRVIKALIERRGDYFTSDREVVCLAVALTEEGISIEMSAAPSIEEDIQKLEEGFLTKGEFRVLASQTVESTDGEHYNTFLVGGTDVNGEQFYAYGPVWDLNDPMGVSVDHCGTPENVRDSLNRRAFGRLSSESEKSAFREFINKLDEIAPEQLLELGYTREDFYGDKRDMRYSEAIEEAEKSRKQSKDISLTDR